MILKRIYFSIYFAIFIAIYKNVNGNWLLERSFENKPIYLLKNETSMWKNEVGESCREQLSFMLNGKPFESMWATNMLDSNALYPPGLTLRQYTSVGSYKECLLIHSEHKDKPVNGQFCFMTFFLSNDTNGALNNFEKKWILETYQNNSRYPYSFGICIPEACSKEELNNIFNISNAFQQTNIQNIRVQYCQVDKNQTIFEKIIENNNVFTVPILMAATFFVFIGSLWHIFGNNRQHWLMFFSIFRNTKNIFKITKTGNNSIEQHFIFLHGLRAIAMLWILIGHVGSFMPAIMYMKISFVANHPRGILSLIKDNMFSNIMANGFFAVQTFFFLSGFLLTSLVIKKNLAKNLSFISFIILRWIRFSVPLFGSIVIMKILFMLWRGPFFTPELHFAEYKNCQDSELWKTLLYFGNYFHESCNKVSWYLTTDLQLHIIGYVLILALKRNSYRMVYILSLFFSSLSIIIPIIFLLLGYPTFDPTSFIEFFDINTRLEKWEVFFFYSSPHMHFGAFFYGSIIGTLFIRNENFLKNYRRFIFNSSLIAMISVTLYREPKTTELYNSELLRGILIGISFFFWNLSLGMICYQLALPEVPKHAQWLNKFLCHPFFQPISRLSFSIYLSQMVVIILNFNLVEDVHHINLHTAVMFSLTCLVETFILAWLLFILFESPIHHFLKYIAISSKEIHKPTLEYKLTNPEQKMVDIEHNSINNNNNNNKNNNK